MATVFLKQAIQFRYKGDDIQLGLGYNRIPKVIVDDFSKTEFCEALLDEGKIVLDAKHGGSDEEKRWAARKNAERKLREYQAEALPGPSDLVEARAMTDVQGTPTGRWELRDRLHRPTGRTFDTEAEAFEAAETHNDRAWAKWLAKQGGSSVGK